MQFAFVHGVCRWLWAGRNRHEAWLVGYLPEGVDPRDPLASPLYADDLAGVAPAFVITAEYDTLRDEGEAHARKLVEAGNLVQVRRYLGAVHGFFTMTGMLCLARQALGEVAEFLRLRLHMI